MGAGAHQLKDEHVILDRVNQQPVVSAFGVSGMTTVNGRRRSRRTAFVKTLKSAEIVKPVASQNVLDGYATESSTRLMIWSWYSRSSSTK